MARLRESLTPDGSTVVFFTTATYTPNTVFVFRNGQLQAKDFVIERGGQKFEVCDIIDADEALDVDYEPRC